MTEQDKNQYNLATSNFYLNLKTRLERDIKKAEETLDDCKIVTKLHHYLGMLEQVTNTLSYVESVYKQSIIK
jgi:hypothetical protein